MTAPTIKLPAAPVEVPRVSSLTGTAPRFHAAIVRVIADMSAQGMPCRVVETLRSAERQAYLYGFGRLYDDGRGVVTKARTHLTSWHGYGLAADLVHAERYWNASPAFWQTLGEVAERHGLTWGGHWKSPDRPHVQWGGCPVSPGDTHRQLMSSGGIKTVWRSVGAA